MEDFGLFGVEVVRSEMEEVVVDVESVCCESGRQRMLRIRVGRSVRELEIDWSEKDRWMEGSFEALIMAAPSEVDSCSTMMGDRGSTKKPREN